MGDTGFEHPAYLSGKSHVRSSGGNNSGNKRTETGPQTPPAPPAAMHIPPTDPELTGVIVAWADLPPAVRAGIVAMVQAAAAAQEVER